MENPSIGERKRPPLVVVAGPTAAGKTALSLDLAESLGGEIISADSMQVYRGMDIGSAKIREEEKRKIPHHLIDILSPWEEFHIVRFQELAKKAMDQIFSRGHIPILVGGTGFYIQALTRDIDFTSAKEDSSYRQELEELARTQGGAVLHEMLQKVDPQSAKSIHENNIKRTIRALEFYHQNQAPISVHNERERQKTSPYNLLTFVLTMPRNVLYQRIEQRVDQMLEEGLVEEVERLRRQGCHRGMVSMQGLGYKEILAYLEGETSLEEAVAILKRDTRHFAKRQLTWFRRETDAIWIDQAAFDYQESRILSYMLKECKKKICLN